MGREVCGKRWRHVAAGSGLAHQDDAEGEGVRGRVVRRGLGYFERIKSGQECAISWVPGTGLETKVAGVNKPPMNDEQLAAAVSGIWLGERPVQDDIKKDVVARAGSLAK